MVSVPSSLSISSWTPDSSGFRPALFPDDQDLTITLVPNTTSTYLFTWENINGHTRKMTLSWNSTSSLFQGSSITVTDQHGTSIYADVTITISYSETNCDWTGSLSMPEEEPTGTPGTFVAEATGGQGPDGPNG
jgi:hypothetical protein